ncbi:hypothetical protein FRB95_001142 [Tulasnella sp. JGI-2019a]|nr:hypothetical protein FRB95_001142 [Tulasnella sp. JGI-2019a]
MDPMYCFSTGVSLIREALRQNLGITHLAVSPELQEASHSLLQVVPHLQLLRGWSSTTILTHIQEASSLHSLRVDGISEEAEDDDPPSTLQIGPARHKEPRVEGRSLPHRHARR